MERSGPRSWGYSQFAQGPPINAPQRHANSTDDCLGEKLRKDTFPKQPENAGLPTGLILPHRLTASGGQEPGGGHLPGRGGTVPAEQRAAMAVFTLQFCGRQSRRLSCRGTVEGLTKEF